MLTSFISLRRAALVLGLVLAPAAVLAQTSSPLVSSPADIESQYQREVARCNAGQSGEDQATCLREAAAARQQAQQGGLTDPGNYSQNALARCNSLPASQRQDCITLMRSSRQSEGSVSSGGVLREITIPVPAAPSAPMPAPGTTIATPIQ